MCQKQEKEISSRNVGLSTYGDYNSMPLVFIRTASSMALEKLLYMVIAIIVGGGFASLFWFMEMPPMVVKIASTVAVVIALIMFIKLVREAFAILKDGRCWQVEITDAKLSWFSPLPDQMESFEVKLSDIASVQQKLIQYKNSKRSPKTTFHIEFTDGRKRELDPQSSGINPAKVFRALEAKGIEFVASTEKRGSKFIIET